MKTQPETINSACNIVPGRYSIYDHIETLPGGREELMEEVASDFAYNPVRSEHDRYANKFVPWHWHQEVEMFMCEQGSVVYEVPHQKVVVHAGDAGLVNANVLHSTHALDQMSGANLRIHMFRPSFIAESASRIWQQFVEPLTSATSVGLLVARANGSEDERALCKRFEASFTIFEQGKFGWEIDLRNEVSGLWMGFFKLAQDRLNDGPQHMPSPAEERLKAMLDFIRLNYYEDITVADIALAGSVSECEAYRTFKSELGSTPQHYLCDYRVEQACRMLAHTTRPLAAVAHMSGLGSPSYFGKVFKDCTGKNPTRVPRHLAITGA